MLVDDYKMQLMNELGIKTDLAKACFLQALDNILLLDKKQQDYGSMNLTVFGTFGVAVRATDKVARLGNLLKPGSDHITTAIEETIADTFGDLSNYGLIGQVMHKKDWP